MARRLRIRNLPTVRKAGGAPRSDRLDQWLDGAVWELRQGVDFQTSVHVFQGLLRKAAKRRGKRFSYSDQGGGVILVKAEHE